MQTNALVSFLCCALAQKPVGGKFVASILYNYKYGIKMVKIRFSPSWSLSAAGSDRSVMTQAGRVSSSFWTISLCGIDGATKPCWSDQVDIHVYKHRVATVIVICGGFHYFLFNCMRGGWCAIFIYLFWWHLKLLLLMLSVLDSLSDPLIGRTTCQFMIQKLW